LYVAKNNDVATKVASRGTMALHPLDAGTFPSLDFPDLPADLADDPTAQYRFTTWAGNVRVYALDSRTFLPNPVVPMGYAAVQSGDLLDSRIQIVWPHDEGGNYAPVETAPFVNVAVDLFAHGTLRSVAPDFQPYHDFGPILSVAEGDGPLHLVRGMGQAEKTIYTANGLVYPRWVFDDVPVQPGQQYNFLAAVTTDLKKESVFTTIWTHSIRAQPGHATPRLPASCQM
jgi:hypothetical protein